MSLASRVVNLFSSIPTSDPPGRLGPDEDNAGGILHGAAPKTDLRMEQKAESQDITEVDRKPPYLHCMLAGGIGGTTGDLLMHSLDTVKTRQQGDPHFPPRYTTMSSTYATIFRQEGIRRGLYGGVFPAFLGSFPGTVIFFGTYEYVKRNMIDRGINASVAYFTGGLVADLAASVVYVPSEVLKTRLQLQGRYNNPFFHSGYNYRSSLDAARTIIRQEGLSALFYGYKATLCRDLPFSALQFAFYEKGQTWSKEWVGSRDIGLPLEILTAASAGGLAGVMTCPLDVVKTRVQTQLNPTETPTKEPIPQPKRNHSGAQSTTIRATKSQKPAHSSSRHQIHSSRVASAAASAGTMTLNTTSIITGLKLMYKAEGIAGWFRGVGPRFVWTSVQSTTMLVLYQIILRQFETHPLIGIGESIGGTIVPRPG
ncbi:MAG: hypothetical protein M1816_000666 [Peltula sp. TS41687]|nr:MAG: hypothetical protein M1816_000666 [Peltula sp. TS41687]